MHIMIIPSKALGRNVEVWIDDDDRERVEQYKWYVNKDGYVVTMIFEGRRIVKSYRLHRFIMNPPKGIFIDHKYGNRQDNRKANLRPCHPWFNGANRRSPGRVRGVMWHKKPRRWAVTLGDVHAGGSYKGYFTDKNAAINCYNYHAREKYGEFASLNDCVPMTKDEWEAKRCRKKQSSIYTLVGFDKGRRKWLGYYWDKVKKACVSIKVCDSEEEASKAVNAYIRTHNIDSPGSVLREMVR